MKNIIILIGSRLINGVFGLLLFAMIKIIIDHDGYGSFSSSFANLSLLSTLAGGVLGGLLLKNAFYFGSAYQKVIYLYVGLFIVLMIAPLELSLFFEAFNELSRLTIYLFILTHLFSSVALIHYQLKQEFGLMATIEIFRTVFPLVIIFTIKYLFDIKMISINQVILIMALGNLLGILLLLKLTTHSANGDHIDIKQYIKEKLRSDLFYSFSFASFNALGQLMIARDRNLILLNHSPSEGANVAYTADQLTKVTNGILFPLNTKVSSELGNLIRTKSLNSFHQKINRYTLFTLLAGLVITICSYLITHFGNSISLIKELDSMAVIYYGLANTFYLAGLVYQKRYDYTKLKLLPTILLLLAGIIAFMMINYITLTISYFFITATIFGLLLLLSGLILPKHKLELNY